VRRFIAAFLCLSQEERELVDSAGALEEEEWSSRKSLSGDADGVVASFGEVVAALDAEDTGGFAVAIDFCHDASGMARRGFATLFRPGGELVISKNSGR